MEELIDLVNEHGKVIDTKPKLEIISRGLKNFRLVCAFVERHDGKIVIPQRSFTKKVFPGALGLIGGYVQSGESFHDALLREVFEELGLSITSNDIMLLGYADPWKHGVHGYVAVFKIRTNQKEFPLSKEFEQLFFLSPAEIKEKIQSGVPVTNNLSILLSRFYRV